jgi:cytochrome c-type biogenesis protein
MTETTFAVAFSAGIATFFSPCAYALLPGYIGYYVGANETEETPLVGALVRGLAAAVGVLAVFLGLGLLAALVGDRLRPVFPALELAVGAVLVGLGALLVAGRSFELSVRLPERRTGVVGFVGFGALYALAAAGCVAPLFLSVLFQSFALSPTGTVAAFLIYAGVFAALLVSVTVATAVGDEFATATVAPYAAAATRLAGALVLVAGLGQIAVAVGW